MSNTTATTNPNCTACDGTGLDSLFGSDCSECWIDADREAALAARYAGVQTLPSDRAHTPGERLDGRRFGNAEPGNGMTEKQAAFLDRLLAEREAGTSDLLTAARAVLASSAPLRKAEASKLIDALLATPKQQQPTTAAPAAAPATEVRPNRYGGSCTDCGQHVATEAGQLGGKPGAWTVRHLDGGCPTPEEAADDDGLDLRPLEQFASDGKLRVGVPGGDTRLKLSIRFRRNGMIYVDDAAVYGHGASYGRQRPSGSYEGDVTDELEAILADPHAAVARYGQLTSRCGVCGRKLEDKESVERGIGPKCAQRFG